jgi:hypothetical protein
MWQRIFAHLIRFLVGEATRGFVERSRHRIQNLPNGQVRHCDAFSMVAQRAAPFGPPIMMMSFNGRSPFA